MRNLYAFAALLATCAVSLADPPRPGGPYRVAVGELAEIEIEAKDGTLGFHNPFPVSELFIREAVPRRKDAVSFIVQPRVAKIYNLTAWTVGERTGVTLVIDASVTPQPPKPIPPGPTPDPTPDPKPKPDPGPAPAPITSDHWFIVIEETSTRTLEMAQLLDFRKWDTLGARYRFYDPNSPDVKKQGYDKLVSTLNLKLPVLFVFDKAGNVVDARELPRTFEEIKKIKTGFTAPATPAPPPPPPPGDNPPTYRDSSQLRVRNETWGSPPAFNIGVANPVPKTPANVVPVKVQANPFVQRPVQDTTLATIAPVAAGANIRLPASTPGVRTITGAPLAGQFGITNCVSG